MASNGSKASRAVIYCRVSTAEQAREGISLEAQEETARAYCKLRGLEVADVIVDAGVSAFKALAKREGGAQLISAIERREVGAIVSYKLDRLFRSAVDCLSTVEGWDRSDVAFHLIDYAGQAVDTSTAAGKFFITLMAGVAEMERNLAAERTAAALAHKRTKGEYCGGQPPFGFRVANDGVHLAEEPAEQVILALARRQREKGVSLRGICEKLAKRGARNRRGRKFSLTQVVRMVS